MTDAERDIADKSRLFASYDQERRIRICMLQDPTEEREFLDKPIKKYIVPNKKVVSFKDEVYQKIVDIRQQNPRLISN